MLPREGRPPTKRRVDYRPPAFCIDTLHLTFDLDPEATEVTAVLAFRRNPGGSKNTSYDLADAPHQNSADPG